ncbi:rhodanese-like domain-containing protein [Bacillus sp. Au-Bac7]|uniref:rhodanese-like domain-containing protein n=1 Tax=Bacillus sp. Au-Bac7 TaxID=2906458 RepID=UPI001E534B8A|nr:rhodanese-like domain-containing protein [Bacillus sp. Au-Bac7]MCE4049269.1 rhodanese-like domain-containing protein [Bacillus sp. Au-Bac7]
MKKEPRYSLTLDIQPSEPEAAYAHFMKKLSFEADVADLLIDLKKGYQGLTVIDVRDELAYEECHITEAISFPGNKISDRTVGTLPKDKLIVVYCWGPACNGATRTCAKLSKLGFKVKELIGGLEYWRKEGGAVSGTLGEKAPMYWAHKH